MNIPLLVDGLYYFPHRTFELTTHIHCKHARNVLGASVCYRCHTHIWHAHWLCFERSWDHETQSSGHEVWWHLLGWMAVAFVDLPVWSPFVKNPLGVSRTGTGLESWGHRLPLCSVALGSAVLQMENFAGFILLLTWLHFHRVGTL